MKMCIACGMPMTKIADYPSYDISRNYCKYCAKSDGTMKTFNEKLADLTLRYTQYHSMNYAVAKQTATVILKKLPAWKHKW
ncbi:putative zinc ribbon protein [Orbus hercynius]|uniref:Putative zinc ribbon protein n=2 Tax=Orbus hercynius TaxID=593135 RepID=A0A495RJP9_9GAMM|nr:putative zinc ribbon protein [Orbus hercynius]